MQGAQYVTKFQYNTENTPQSEFLLEVSLLTIIVPSIVDFNVLNVVCDVCFWIYNKLKHVKRVIDVLNMKLKPKMSLELGIIFRKFVARIMTM